MLLIINAILYGIVIWVLYKTYRICSNKRIFLFLGSLVIVGYVAVYIPSIQQRLAFKSWAESHPPLDVLQEADFTEIEGIYLPHLNCTLLCKDLLLSGRVDFIETKSSMIRQIGSDFVNIDQPYLRWTIRRDENYCWSDGPARSTLAITTNSFERMSWLLARGICFQYEPIGDPRAELRFTQEWTERHTPKNSRTLFKLGIFEARKFKLNSETVLARGHYRWESILAFPLRVYLKFYYLPQGFDVVRTSLSHGGHGFYGFVEAFLRINNLRSTKPFQEQPTSAQLETTRRAITAENPYVRWSAAIAVCELKRHDPERFGPWIKSLLSDKNDWVRAAAQLIDKQRLGQNLCYMPMRYLDGKRLSGAFFSKSSSE